MDKFSKFLGNIHVANMFKFPFFLLLKLPPGGLTVMWNTHKTLIVDLSLCIVYQYYQNSKGYKYKEVGVQ